MESVNIKHSAREKYKFEWLKKNCGLGNMECRPLAHDASFRRYFRISQGNETYVLMDAPPPEHCASFVAIAAALRTNGLQAPVVFQSDLEHGFLLLTDFGDHTYLNTLNDGNVDQLYTDALRALITLQAIRTVDNYPVPPFTGAFMRQEWEWHKEWFLQKLLGINLGKQENLLNDCFDLLVNAAVNQPQVFMHRDYHSANLMVLANKGPGILDFQDAFIGPVTYDLVSLIRDCYIDWPQASVQSWVRYYWQALKNQNVIDVEQKEFNRWVDWMALERHLKALFTYARKKVRDDQPRYLKYIPRALNYIVNESSQYPELSRLNEFYKNQVMPLCVQ